MITNSASLRLAFDQLSRTYKALAGLQADHPDASPQWLSVMAEGFLDHARQLQEEIDAYLGAADQTATEKVEQHIGELREIDLDNLTVILRSKGDAREVRCTLEEFLLDAAKEALDRRVRVSGVPRNALGRRMVSTFQVFRLEILEEIVPAEDRSAEKDAEFSL